MNAICLITFQPKKIWCDFINQFHRYKIFVIIDDNNFNCLGFQNSYKNITFVQIDNKKCEACGYLDTNFTLHKKISGWDKALYYFGVENTNNNNIWFIEDDVYFYNEETMLNIDKQYVNSDLLSNNCGKNEKGENKDWLWHRININFAPPYYCGMMCAVRFSKQMRTAINEYARIHKTLFFLEALFPTIAAKHNLRHDYPNELTDIHYRRKFQIENINRHKLYHPVKELDKHILFRQQK